MNLDAISLKIALLESKHLITSLTVSKITQHRNGEFIFYLNGKTGNFILVISINPNFLTFFVTQNLDITINNLQSNYLITLKHYLEGAKLLDINQLNSDRIIVLNFKKINNFYEKYYTLFFQFFSKDSNSFLYDGLEIKNFNFENVIAIFKESNKICDFINNSNNIDITTCVNNRSVNITEDIKNYTGLSPNLLLVINKNKILINDALIEIAKIFLCNSLEDFNNLINHKKNNNSILRLYNPAIYYKIKNNQTRYFAYPFDITGNFNNNLIQIDKEFPKFSECLVNLYTNQNKNIILEKIKNYLLNLQNIIKRKKEIYQMELDNAKKYNEYFTYASLIIENISQLKQQNINNKKINNILINNINIPLDSSKTVFENSQQYFKLAKKLRIKNEYYQRHLLEIAKLELKLLGLILNVNSLSKNIDINVLENLKQQISFILKSFFNNDEKQLKKMENEFENYIKDIKLGFSNNLVSRVNNDTNKYYRYFELENNCQIYIGRSALGNDYILSKVAKPEDYWLHVKDFKGSSVILKVSNNINDDLLNQAINEAALYAAYYSDGRNATKIFVVCTKRKYVKKLKNFKGKVTYSNEMTILIDNKEFEKKFNM